MPQMPPLLKNNLNRHDALDTFGAFVAFAANETFYAFY